jgi:hypothetical protein
MWAVWFNCTATLPQRNDTENTDGNEMNLEAANKLQRIFNETRASVGNTAKLHNTMLYTNYNDVFTYEIMAVYDILSRG